MRFESSEKSYSYPSSVVRSMTMLRSGKIAVVYFILSISWIIIDCQSDEYILQKNSFDSRPNEQPFLFIEKKHSRPAIPEFLNNIPQLTLNGNEKLVLSCPESFPPGETMSSVDTPITVTGGASHNDPAAGSEIESHAHPATILSADTQPETVGKTFTTLASTSTVDSVNTIPVGSSPRTTRLAGESSQQEHVEERVTKKVATFYNSEIRFNWELPYLKCQRPAKVAVRNLYKPCQDNGGVYEIGFWKYKWRSLITVCYNMHELRPVYTQHTLYGSAIKAAAKLMMRPNIFDYEEPFQPYTVDLKPFYDKDIQYDLFKNILGDDIAFTYNDTVSKFLIPLQLVSPAEMLSPVSTLATYSFMATTPGWEAVALRNWKKLNKMVQIFADENKVKLVSYSGTVNILQLQNSRGELKNMYLKYNENLLAVARIIYRLIYDELLNKAIIFFVSNNPYVNDSSYQICVDVCSLCGWMNEFWKNLDGGYITCCHYKEVKNTFSSLPQIGDDKTGLLINFPPDAEHTTIPHTTVAQDVPSTSHDMPTSASTEIEVA